jgi:hypothetical protein
MSEIRSTQANEKREIHRIRFKTHIRNDDLEFWKHSTISASFCYEWNTYCHGFSDRRRGIGLTIGFIVHFNQLQLSISILQPPTLWAPLSIYPAFSLGSILGDH